MVSNVFKAHIISYLDINKVPHLLPLLGSPSFTDWNLQNPMVYSSEWHCDNLFEQFQNSTVSTWLMPTLFLALLFSKSDGHYRG